MTVTIVYGDLADGYLWSFDPTYAGSRNGPADAVVGGTAAYYGQDNNSGGYATFQTFLRFAYPAVAAGSIVTAATVQTYQLTRLSPGTARDLEYRGYTWSGGGLELADWRTPAQLSSSGLYATVRGAQASQGEWALAGSETLRAWVQGNTAAEFVLTSSRQRAGSTPTTDEGSSIATADEAGTAFDPRLIFTTTPNQSIMPGMGMEAQLSDGSWVYGVRPLLSTTVMELRRATPDGAAPALLASIPLGTTSASWANVPALQGMTLVADSQDNIFIVGRAGDAPNSIRAQAYRKAAGSWTWSPGTIRTQAAPSHDAPINNVTAAWHSTGNGTLVVFASHGAGDGVGGGQANDVVYLLLYSTYLVDGSREFLRGSGSASAASLLPSAMASGDFSGYANEVGTGLDVVADRGQPDWGYVTSFRRSQRVGESARLAVGRYVLASDGTGLVHSSYEESHAYGTKDAGSRVRLLGVGSGQVALVTADRDAGWGITVEVLQATGTTAGLVSLGKATLGGEAIPGHPDGPAVGTSPAWDAVYSQTENAVWVYYVDTTSALQLRRTSVNLDTYHPTRVTALVLTAGSAIQAVRVPRNAPVTQKGHVMVAGTPSGTTSAVDNFNQAPLAPTLTPKANYDATAAATFAWTFNDPNTTDPQAAYQLQVVRVSDGVTVLDTGKVLSAVPSRNVAGGTLANGQTYQWRVMTWDALDLAGPWSDYGSVTTNAGGSVNITTPAVDNPPNVITDDLQVSWTVTGTVPTKLRAWVVRNDTGATVYDSGWVTSAVTTWLVTGMVSDVEHTVRVQVENASAVRSGIGTRLVTPSYGAPEVPLLVVTPVPEGGHVLVSVDNPVPGGDRPDVVRNRVLRRRVGAVGPWDLLGETGPDGSFRDYTVPSRVPVEYMVRGETA